MSVKGNILFCPDCNYPQPQINFTVCENCGHDLGPPNVNIVSTEDELKALQKRYDDGKNYSVSNGTKDALDNFENYFKANVRGIINMSLDTLFHWIVTTGKYKPYQRAWKEGLRNIADLFNDQKRTSIDGLFYGGYGEEIIYGALTLNNKGLESYGNCRVILNEDSIKSRSSTLEENSFIFVKTHNIKFYTINIPAGYRSTWHNKLKLAVAKLHSKLSYGNVEKDFTDMVLLSTGDKNTDEFIELHIYKELTKLAVKFIFVPKPINNRKDAISVRAIEEKSTGIVNRF